jgi:hypothetical protein
MADFRESQHTVESNFGLVAQHRAKLWYCNWCHFSRKLDEIEKDDIALKS